MDTWVRYLSFNSFWISTQLRGIFEWFWIYFCMACVIKFGSTIWLDFLWNYFSIWTYLIFHGLNSLLDSREAYTIYHWYCFSRLDFIFKFLCWYATSLNSLDVDHFLFFLVTLMDFELVQILLYIPYWFALHYLLSAKIQIY